MKNVWYIVIGAAIILVIFFLVKNNYVSVKVSSVPEPTQTEVKSDMEARPTPAMSIDKSKNYTATLKTEKGDIVISLTADKTPITANNFVTLAKKGFYNKTVF